MHLSELVKEVSALKTRVEALESQVGTSGTTKRRSRLLNEDGADVTGAVIVPGAEDQLIHEGEAETSNDEDDEDDTGIKTLKKVRNKKR